MYALYIDNEYYEYNHCLDCWYRDCGIDPEKLIKPASNTCHMSPQIKNLSYNNRYLLFTERFIYNTPIVFRSILQALTFYRTVNYNYFDYRNTVLHEIEPTDDIRRCGSQHHIHPDKVKLQRVWNLNAALLDYALSLEEDFGTVNLAYLMEISFDRADLVWYQKLQDAGCDVLGADVAKYFHDNRENFCFPLKHEDLLAFASVVLPVVAAIMIRSYIRYAAKTDLASVLANFNPEAIQPYALEIVVNIIYDSNRETLEEALIFYDKIDVKAIMCFTDYNRKLDLPGVDDVWQHLHVKDIWAVEWFLAEGIPIDWFQDTYLIGCQDGCFEIISRLHHDMPPNIQALGLRIAACELNCEIFSWLLHHHTLSPDTIQAITSCSDVYYECACILQSDIEYAFTDRQLTLLAATSIPRSVKQISLPKDDLDTLTSFKIFADLDCNMQILTSNLFQDFDANSRIAKTSLVGIVPHDRRVILDLADELDDMTFCEFIILNCRPEYLDYIENIWRLDEIDLTRWQHYFAPGHNAAYMCQENHPKCYTLNLWYQYFRAVGENATLQDILANGWLAKSVAKYLRNRHIAREYPE